VTSGRASQIVCLRFVLPNLRRRLLATTKTLRVRWVTVSRWCCEPDALS